MATASTMDGVTRDDVSLKLTGSIACTDDSALIQASSFATLGQCPKTPYPWSSSGFLH